MQQEKNSSQRLMVIPGLLTLLMPLSIDMYLPALAQIVRESGVSSGSMQMTLNVCTVGFAPGQLIQGSMADSLRRKSVIVLGTLVFAIAAAACALSQTIGQLINMRLLHEFSAASGSVVVSALMYDSFSRQEFSRMMSFVMLVIAIAPLLVALAGGQLLVFWSCHAIFPTLFLVAMITTLLVHIQIRETLPAEKRQQYMVGTASSLAGRLRFGIGTLVGIVLSNATITSAWPMLWAITFCATASLLLFFYASPASKAL